MRIFVSAAVGIGAALVLVAACSTPPERGGEAAGETVPADRPVPTGRPGGLAGSVLYEGSDVPRSTTVLNTTNPGECAPVQSLHDLIVSPQTRGIQNVVISLGEIALPEGTEFPAADFRLENRNCQFDPHVTALTAGSAFQSGNRDAISHSVHIYGPFEANVALGPGQAALIGTLTRPGYYVVKCDLHSWMQAYLRVDRHPFHAVTGTDGVFRIETIPPGSYPVEIWHEVLGKRTMEVQIRPGETTQVSFHLP